jgi:PAS domain S-box-containing protein
MGASPSLGKILSRNFILAAVLPIFIVGLITLSLVSRNISDEVAVKNLSIARSLAGEVERFLNEPSSLLGQVRDVLATGSIREEEETSAYLDALIGNYSFFSAVHILDEGGEVTNLAPYDEEVLGLNMSYQPFYRTGEEKGTPFWSPTFISPQTEQPTLALSRSLRAGTVVGYLNLEVLRDMIGRVGTDTGTGGYAVILDEEGTVLSHRVMKNALERRNLKNLAAVRQSMAAGEGTYPDRIDGADVLASIALVPQTGWMVVYFQEKDEAFALTRSIFATFSLVTAVSVALAVLVSLDSLKRLLAPFSALVEKSRRVAGGKYERTALEGSYSEIDDLSRNLDHMIDAVQQREAALRESEGKYRELAELLPEAVFEMNTEGIITYANRSAFSLFGYSQEEMEKGLKGLALIAPGDRERAVENLKLISHGADIGMKEYRAVKKGDTVFPALFHSTAILRKGVPVGVRGVIVDLSEKKRTEDQLRQAQKMEAIGTLAGGIAHDFNNILAALLGYCELAMMDASGNRRLADSLGNIMLAGKRARNLVSQILTFSRQSSREPRPIQPKIVVKEALKLLRASLPTTIAIEQNLDSESTVLADPTELHQVVMNLCTNAAYAMDESGGTLTVTLTDIDLEEIYAAHRSGMGGRYIDLTVRDTGTGIAGYIKDRIFDPYFTTKPKEEGTGMGLSMVHGIVERCGGTITVESAVGEGTEISVFLPSRTEAMKVEATGELPTRGTERILFVDDEPVLGTLARQALERYGYRLTVFSDSEEALRRFSADPGAWDLVITDMTMPQLTGDILARRMMLSRKDIPIIMTTGFSEKIDEAKALAMGIRALEYKPIAPGRMAEAIRKVMDG